MVRKRQRNQANGRFVLKFEQKDIQCLSNNIFRLMIMYKIDYSILSQQNETKPITLQ